MTRVKTSITITQSEIRQIQSLKLKPGLDIQSLFTVIALEEVVENCTNVVLKNVGIDDEYIKSEFKILSLAAKELNFTFDDNL